ncbi:hypothetical protein [uncultured Bacteroides sp.]|nr:hypothetical protein [uncultured Bacteroides sp.]
MAASGSEKGSGGSTIKGTTQAKKRSPSVSSGGAWNPSMSTPF